MSSSLSQWGELEFDRHRYQESFVSCGGRVSVTLSLSLSKLACSLFILFYLIFYLFYLIELTAVVSKTELSNGNYVILGFFAALLFRGQLRAYVEIQSWSYNWWLSIVKSPKVFLTVSVVSLSYLEVTDLLKTNQLIKYWLHW